MCPTFHLASAMHSGMVVVVVVVGWVLYLIVDELRLACTCTCVHPVVMVGCHGGAFVQLVDLC